MSVILVVEQDARYAERISDALRADGLSVEAAGSRAEALSLARSRSPRLLLASSTLTRAPELLAAFSRSRGGPGSVVLVSDAAAPRVSAADFEADEILAEPFSDDDLRQLVQHCLKAAPSRQQLAPRPTNSSEQLTSDDIFGDVLAEVDAEAQRARTMARARRPAIPMEDIERKLEETLSGVIPIAGKKKRPSVARAPEPAGTTRKRPALPDDSEIDALLDQTLSSLDIPTRGRKPAPVSERREEVARLDNEAVSPPRSTQEAEPPAAEPPAVEPATVEPPTAEPPAAEPPPAATVDEPVPHPEPLSPSLGPAVTPSPDPRPAPATGLDELWSPADQFRTQALPTFDAGKEAAEGETFGDYALLERIALGGMAEVWRARRRGVEGFEKSVAIKKILSHLTGSPDFVTMFIDEAKLAAQLTHNNIIQIYDLGKVGDDFFIAMELVDGKDLRSILTATQDTGRPVPMGLGLFIISAVARALDYAHRKRDFDNRALGLVHRDVSPQNVLISYEGAIKLCDFGIVKAVAKASVTQMGALKGKLQYMSPEQAWGTTVDARSDIFSLGSVLFEVLTGTQLFAGESEISVLDAVRDCQIRSPREIAPEIPEEVDLIVRKALAKTPGERYQTAGDLEHEIKATLDELRPAPSQKDLSAYLRSLFAPAGNLAPAEAAAARPPGGVQARHAAPPVASSVTPAAEKVLAAREEPLDGEAWPTHEEPPAEQPDGDAGTQVRATSVVTEPAAGRSWRWLAAAIIVGILVALGLLFLRSQRQKETPTPVSSAPAPAAEEPPLALPASGSPPGGTPPGDAILAEDAMADGAETGEVASGEEGGLAAAIAEIDIEQMVNEELTNRAERLRQDFETEKKRIEEELAKTQAAGSRPSSNEEAEDGESGGGS